MRNKKYFLSLFAAIILIATGYALAHALPYAPGQTLDPSCNPGDANCTVRGVIIDNGTVAGINASSSTISLNVQGSGTLNPLNVASSSGTSFLIVLANGNVGIGTTSPQYLLDVQKSSGGNLVNVQSNNSYSGIQGVSYRNSATTHVVYDGYGYRGTFSSPTVIQTGDSVTAMRGEAYMGTPGGGNNGDGTNEIGDISIRASGLVNQGVSNAGGEIWFETTQSGTTAASEFPDSRMWIGDQDNIGIGTGSVNCAANTTCFIDEKATASFPTQVYFGSTNGGNGDGGNVNTAYSTKVVIVSGTSQGTVPLFTVASTTITSSGSLGVNTSTPVSDFQATNISSNATTTIEFGKSGQNKGTCLKLYRTDGSAIYASVAAGTTTFTLSTTPCASVSGF